MNTKHFTFSSLILLCLLTAACEKEDQQSTTPDSDTTKAAPTPEEGIELDQRDEQAAECFANSRVRRFNASPATVQPFASTQLSWEVSAPASCRMQIAVGGQRKSLVDQVDFTPVRAQSTVELQALTLGAMAVLARREIAVDISDCNTNLAQISESQAKELLRDAIGEKDRNSDKFDVIGDAAQFITLESRGLVFALPMRVFKTALNARVHVGDVVLDMVVDFLVREGTILPKYKLFQPNTRSVLEPSLDFGGTLSTEIQSAVFEESASILDALRKGINESAAARLASLPGMQLFEIVPELQQMSLTLCPVELAPEPEPQPPEFSLQQCLDSCDLDQEICKSEGQTEPSVCAAIQGACAATCRESF